MLNVKVKELFEDPVLIPSNMLSILRIILTPVLIWFMMMEHSTGDMLYRNLAVIAFIVIIISDFLDGFLARLLNQVTRLGQFLDPVADKVIVLSLSAGLALYKDFPVGLAVFIWVREIAVFVICYFLYSKRDVEVKPNMFGKICVTASAIMAFVFIINFDMAIMDSTLFTVKNILIFIMLLFYILGGIQYVRTYFYDKPAEN